MRDNITLKKQTKFVRGVKNGLIELGAEIINTSISFGNTQFVLNTVVGPLYITLYKNQSFLYTVYSKFENVEQAKLKFNCNPYSGKYNIHYSAKGNTEKYAIQSVLRHFECTI